MANLPRTGFSSTSPQNFVVGAGSVVYDFDISTYEYKKLGATSGGTQISLTTTLTQLEIDGILSTPVGGDVIESSEGTMEVNLTEFSLDNFALALNGKVLTDDNGKYVRSKPQLEEQDYIKNLAYISPLGSGKALVIIFDYAIVTEGASLNPQDSETNTLTVTFSARTAPGNLEDASLPVTVRILDRSKDEVPGV